MPTREDRKAGDPEAKSVDTQQIRPARVSGIDQIWLINLDRRKDRLERFMQSHPEMFGRINRLPAYDGKDLQLTPALARLFAPNNFDWHKPTMGCAMSHLALWYKVAEEADENASYLILEDDAQLEPSWVAKIEKSFLQGHVPDDWEVLFFGGILPKYSDFFAKSILPVNRMVARIDPGCVFGANPHGYFHFCAYSYLLNRRGARRLLDLVKSGNGVWMQADFLACYNTPQLSPPRPVYFLNPLVARSFQDTSEEHTSPYADADRANTTVDSDIWGTGERFSGDEVGACLRLDDPLDLEAALGLAKQGDTSAVDVLPGVDKIWVVNLERRQDRLEKFKATHPDIAEKIHVLKAYDGGQLKLTPSLARLFLPNNFEWHKPTMGCALSHLELWFKLSREEKDSAAYLILEDDAVLSPGWKEKVITALAEKHIPDDWDVLYVGGNPLLDGELQHLPEKVEQNVHRIKENSLWGQNPANRYCHFGAYAYLLSKKGALKTLELLERGNGVWNAIDHVLAYGRSEGDPYKREIYFFHPQVASVYQFESLVGSENSGENDGKTDSDIRNQKSVFSPDEIAPVLGSSAHAQPFDLALALAEASLGTHAKTKAATTRISLLHATRGRPDPAVKARALWLASARHPERVEHLFAIDRDDVDSESLKVYPHVVQESDGYSVGAWNLAASRSTGDILIQLSDDWLPPEGWDDMIAERLDPARESVLWISDGYRKDDLICMAILTRPYYKKHGLFDPAYKNVFSDDDFTVRAKKNHAVIDARDLIIKHEHPHAVAEKPMDATYARGNQRSELVRAGSIFRAKHFPEVYSQNDEQIVIQRYFWEEQGVLWDFGCNDGITLSNSHYLLKNKGWRGILVDASATCIERAKTLYGDRKDIQFLNIGIAEANGVLDFYESGTHLGKGDLGLVSSFKKEATTRWVPTTEYKQRQVRCYDFGSFLAGLARYKTADFISIDVEGLDYEILSAIDLNLTRTRLICVEHNGQNLGKFVDYGRRFGMHVFACNAENLIMARHK